VACARRSFWQVGCWQRLLVHVLEGWRRGPRKARGKQTGATKHRVSSGSPPGLLAFDGNLAVGWCQLTPRDAIPWLEHMWWFQRVDALPVWSISCFFVRRSYRRQRAMTHLVFAALKAAKRAGAAALEAYPIDTDAPNSTSNTFTGTVATFARADFKEVARRAPARPIMRHDPEGYSRDGTSLRGAAPLPQDVTIQKPTLCPNAIGAGTCVADHVRLCGVQRPRSHALRFRC
jgi:GNAT superfamily N-acetyltransferase